MAVGLLGWAIVGVVTMLSAKKAFSSLPNRRNFLQRTDFTESARPVTPYFHDWAVRPVGENRWGFCFHLPSKEEAEGLCGLLNNDD
jgi:hypothetical protein